MSGLCVHNPDSLNFSGMKKLALIIGIISSLIGFFQVVRYLFDYNVLTQYGKGYVWGSILLLLIGILLIYLGLRKRKTT